MHGKTTSASPSIKCILLLCFGVLAGGWFAPARAQTVISPPPLLPLRERPNPADKMPTANAVLDEEHAGEDAAEGQHFHIPLIFNDCVESQIEYFTTRGRAIFQAWLDRSARYLPIMKKIFRENNLPEELAYVAMIESGFNPHAVSPKKAVGQWQFLRATAREYGLVADRWVDERRDPIKATRAAAAHFKDLYNLFGSWPMALASYNAGMGRMQNAMLRGRSDDFWELRASRFIHAETQEYVPKYLAAMIIAKDPLAYGFSSPEAEPFEYDEIEIETSTDLRRIADYTGCSLQEIMELNPELVQHSTPHSSYILRIPVGTRDIYLSRVASAPLRVRKRQHEKERARRAGHLFTKLASAGRRSIPKRRSPAMIVAKYGIQLKDLPAPVPGSDRTFPSAAGGPDRNRSVLP